MTDTGSETKAKSAWKHGKKSSLHSENQSAGCFLTCFSLYNELKSQ
ncbi:hypothetical protein HMPREF9098_1260 [Kingella denitrificans ATCC 33394]|uniref:Uncharacterized protein n=1 Tax=Kingella denitrificans ATCC 33394 TaxID=888741 RepID=F0EZS5_9NEIS|nr:hypothetical protein HMPREF9098_1260 [Kingella denitrificans ATCC 33394]